LKLWFGLVGLSAACFALLKLQHEFLLLSERQPTHPTQHLLDDHRDDVVEPASSIVANGNVTATASFRANAVAAVAKNYNKAPDDDNKNSYYAYAFVIGGVDPDVPTYRAYLYGVMVASYVLRQQGSKSDIVLFYEMYYGSRHETLPPDELDVLRKLGVQLRKIPPTKRQSFYKLQLDKFRILGLTRYRRVLYLDADVMPLCNMDYLFVASDPESESSSSSAVRDDIDADGRTAAITAHQPPLLQENLIVWGKYAPANGGTFMLAPRPGDLERLNRLVQRKETFQNRGHKFDKTGVGWGHEIRWRALHKPFQRGWKFYAAQGDQGLLVRI